MMGKRKRTDDDRASTDPSPSSSSPGNMPFSSRLEILPRKKSSRLLDSNDSKHVSSGMDKGDYLKQLNTHAGSHHRHNLSRSMFLKRSRHHHNLQHSRNCGSHGTASTSQGMDMSPWDEKFFLKLASRYNSDYGRYGENRDEFGSPERIRSNSLSMEVVSPDVLKMVCEICQRSLRRKTYFLGDSQPFNDNSIVAVLVCGHVYHADCLEERTPVEEKSDPACPICQGSQSQSDVLSEDNDCEAIEIQ